MQSRLRKTRSYEGLKRVRNVTFACFTALVLTSCSTQSIKKEEDRFNKVISNLCLNSSGRGRVKMFSQTTLFSFETVNTKDKFWKMAVDIPVHGEELLTLGWENASLGKVKVKGRFAKRILLNSSKHKDSKKYSRLIKGFIRGWSQFVYLNNEFKKHPDLEVCKDGNCKLGPGSWDFEFSDGHAIAKYHLRNKDELVFDFSNFKDDVAQRLSVYTPTQALENTPFKLDLFIKQCQ